MTGKQPVVGRALISVSDKTGVEDLAIKLVSLGVEIISTGGTAKLLNDGGCAVKDVSALTGFPEMMDGRVKTLHPNVHGGLLSVRGNAAHMKAQDRHGISNIDLLVVNLYPFEETAARGAGFLETVENIDIGGPAMIRSAAKNHVSVVVIVDPDDYGALLRELEDNDGATSEAFRRHMAMKAFGRTAAYDSAISQWFASQIDEPAPPYWSMAGTLAEKMRYGENPHQFAAFYKSSSPRYGVATATQVQGKGLSYNNLNDTDAAFELVAEFDPDLAPAVAIIKHANPCGVGVGESLTAAYQKALRCDSLSAFGGIVALNGKLDGATAQEITKIFTEVIIAPDADEDARAVLSEKKNLRLLLTGGLPDPRAEGVTAKVLSGGFLVQGRDNGCVDDLDLKIVTKRAPRDQEFVDLKFAFRVAKHVKSNAIVYAKDGATVGIGAGQMSRIDSARIAALKSLDAARGVGLSEALTKGAVVASEAFFPFADGLQTVADAGVTAVIQPGGSMRDDEVIAAADEAGLAMVFTGMRHFRH